MPQVADDRHEEVLTPADDRGLVTDDSRAQARLIEKFVSIALHCLQLRNYYTSFAIFGYGGISSGVANWMLRPSAQN
jgi:hypothetical protein